LLQTPTANGNCDAWTRLFREALRANGADVLRIPVVSYEGPPPPKSWIVVKNVVWLDPPSYPGTEWPYLFDKIDLSPEGVAGQNMPTPAQKSFEWHLITEYVSVNPPRDTYYDPSYGRSYGATGAKAAFTNAVIAGWGKLIGGEERYKPGPGGETVRFVAPTPWPPG
jgi:hypothetical protein